MDDLMGMVHHIYAETYHKIVKMNSLHRLWMGGLCGKHFVINWWSKKTHVLWWGWRDYPYPLNFDHCWNTVTSFAGCFPEFISTINTSWRQVEKSKFIRKSLGKKKHGFKAFQDVYGLRCTHMYPKKTHLTMVIDGHLSSSPYYQTPPKW